MKESDGVYHICEFGQGRAATNELSAVKAGAGLSPCQHRLFITLGLPLSFQSSLQQCRRQIRGHRETDLRANRLHTYGSDVISPPYGFSQRLASRQEIGQAAHEGISRTSWIHGINPIRRYVRGLTGSHQQTAALA